jgi:hypothetical protein
VGWSKTDRWSNEEHNTQISRFAECSGLIPVAHGVGSVETKLANTQTIIDLSSRMGASAAAQGSEEAPVQPYRQAVSQR